MTLTITSTAITPEKLKRLLSSNSSRVVRASVRAGAVEMREFVRVEVPRSGATVRTLPRSKVKWKASKRRFLRKVRRYPAMELSIGIKRKVKDGRLTAFTGVNTGIKKRNQAMNPAWPTFGTKRRFTKKGKHTGAVPGGNRFMRRATSRGQIAARRAMGAAYRQKLNSLGVLTHG